MNRLIIIVLFIIQIPFLALAQYDESLEIQFYKVDSIANSDIQKFYIKFNLYFESRQKGVDKIHLNKEAMVNNFVIFSEDGLIMKDLNFHSVESCKKQILESRPKPIHDRMVHANWIFVSMESHVNKRELIEILEFLKNENIEYQFGEDNEIMSLIK